MCAPAARSSCAYQGRWRTAPAAAAVFSGERQPRNRPMCAERSPIRILSVDDHPVFREGIAALLSGQSDFKLVAEASNGREAIDQFRRHRPDVTLMDLQMPEMNGVDAMVAIHDEFPSARIIVLTT